MNFNYLRSICCIALGITTTNLFPQQAGNYTPVMVDAKTRSSDGGKARYSEWKPFETRIIDNLLNFDPVVKPAVTRYGSDASQKHSSTGFFRTEQIGNRWWIIDPEGYAGLNIVVNSINNGKSSRNKEAFVSKFGTTEKWIEDTRDQLTALGFNGAGSWSDHEKIIALNKTSKTPLSYCINWSFMSAYGKKRGGTYSVPGHTGYPGNAIFVFDPAFEKFCDQHAKQLAAYKNDPNLFGYFSDNEMPLNLKNLEGYLGLDKTDHGYLAAKKWLDDKGLTTSQITDKTRAEFLAFAGERYFSIVSKAIKKHDPNHLFLGSRFYSKEKNTPEFMKAIGKYLDIISINYYGAWTPNKEYMKNWTEWTGKPFIITEFYTKGADSGLPNISGAGWQVKTQEDRGKAYQNFCMGLLESKNCVGWHWFKYQDNDPAEKNTEASNSDANKGLFDNDYEIYVPLAEKMKQLNFNLYKLAGYFDKINK